MIDFHTHTIFSDGALLPSELVRMYDVLGYKAVGVTDHVDASNIDFVVPRLVAVCKKLNSAWKIKAIPGAEITHAPLEHIEELVNYARSAGAKVIIAHGETVSEPVAPGTNKKALECDIDILAHPGLITIEEAKAAAEKNIFLEVTARKNHDKANTHVMRTADEVGAKLILNSDAHSPEDILPLEKRQKLAVRYGLGRKQIVNAEELLDKIGDL